MDGLHSVTYSLNKSLVSTHYVSGIVYSTGIPQWARQEKLPTLRDLLLGKTDVDKKKNSKLEHDKY